jgi:hypothetical protein
VEVTRVEGVKELFRQVARMWPIGIVGRGERMEPDADQ